MQKNWIVSKAWKPVEAGEALVGRPPLGVGRPPSAENRGLGNYRKGGNFPGVVQVSADKPGCAVAWPTSVELREVENGFRPEARTHLRRHPVFEFAELFLSVDEFVTAELVILLAAVLLVEVQRGVGVPVE